jgi:4-amino-4-deoxy-L-arabinose transferase-like glycosyltransferase
MNTLLNRDMSSPATNATDITRGRLSSGFDFFPYVLGLAVFVSRIAASGVPYWADGPGHVWAIQRGYYVVHSPGYWLFNRTAGLSSDPARAIALMNWFFSAAGAVVFYLVARLLVRSALARLGAVTYSVVFYAWFSGEVHSTYASQLLFPPLILLLLLLYERSGRPIHLLGAAAAFAVGAGFRPSDGAFIGVMFVYFLVRHAPRRDALLGLAVAVAGCLAWLVPTYIGFRHSSPGMPPPVAYTSSILGTASVLRHGVNLRSLANIARYIVPVLAAFWPLSWPILKTLGRWRDQKIILLWLWVLPGSLFFVLIYVSGAPYLNYLTAGLLMLALTALDRYPRPGRVLLSFCLIWNLALFTLVRPLPSKRFPVLIFNAYVGEYSWYGIKHRWAPDLSDLVNPQSMKALE